ncbi:MAG: hypothetical protein JST22_20650 [Bacteroidetes bacterium]|nr:hypothetical protein [Bacteroidota bacterium]
MNEPRTRAPGKIITFYSYKGGTGRSMALANVAWILACSGRRVLMVDWDLEAPGLHRYFRPFLVDPDLCASEGVIDCMLDFAIEALTPATGSKHEVDWVSQHFDMYRYVVSLEWDFPEGATLDIFPAGKQSPMYSTNVNSFDWRNFYDRLGGGAFLEKVCEQMRAEYDFVLIDSRTGVSDTAGICTVQMPDALVACFTVNNQGVDGTAAVVADVFRQRINRPIAIYPVPMRLENAENDKLVSRIAYAMDQFGQFPLKQHIGSLSRQQYWRNVAVPYVPFYAYEEVLAAFVDLPGDGRSVFASMFECASVLAGSSLPDPALPDTDVRSRVRALYSGTPTPVATLPITIVQLDRIYRALPEQDKHVARQICVRLVRVGSAVVGGADTLGQIMLSELGENEARVLADLSASGAIALETNRVLGQDVAEFTDERILRDWALLGEWIAQDRAFLELLEPIRLLHRRWIEGGEGDEILFGRNLIRLIGGRMEGLRNNLTLRENQFIERCISRARVKAHGRRLRIAIASAATVLFMVMVVLVVYLIGERTVRSWNALLSAGSLAIDDGRYRDALMVSDTILRNESDSGIAFLLRGRAYAGLGMFDSALVVYTEAVRLMPDSARAYAGRGIARFTLYMKDDSIRLLQSANLDLLTAIRLDTGSRVAHLYHAMCQIWLDSALNARVELEDLRQRPQSSAVDTIVTLRAQRLLCGLDSAQGKQLQPFQAFRFLPTVVKVRTFGTNVAEMLNRVRAILPRMQVVVLERDSGQVRKRSIQGIVPEGNTSLSDRSVEMGDSVVRCYHPEDLPQAKWICWQFNRVLKVPGTMLTTPFEYLGQVNPGLIDVWLPQISKIPRQNKVPNRHTPSSSGRVITHRDAAY